MNLLGSSALFETMPNGARKLPEAISTVDRRIPRSPTPIPVILQSCQGEFPFFFNSTIYWLDIYRTTSGLKEPSNVNTPSTTPPSYKSPTTTSLGHNSPPMSTPGYRSPSTTPPGYKSPPTSTPGYKSPSTSTPGYKSPSTSMPGYKSPSTTPRGYKSPSTSTPGYKTPSTWLEVPVDDEAGLWGKGEWVCTTLSPQ